jgi:hypothetical protein
MHKIDGEQRSGHERKARRRYMLEMLASMALYSALLAASIVYVRPMAAGLPKTMLLMSPMLGFLLMIWAVARHVRRMDEYVRTVLLENIALAAAITAGLTFSYGFLETAGYPMVSMFHVWVALCACFGLVCLARQWMGR